MLVIDGWVETPWKPVQSRMCCKNKSSIVIPLLKADQLQFDVRKHPRNSVYDPVDAVICLVKDHARHPAIEGCLA